MNNPNLGVLYQRAWFYDYWFIEGLSLIPGIGIRYRMKNIDGSPEARLINYDILMEAYRETTFSAQEYAPR